MFPTTKRLLISVSQKGGKYKFLWLMLCLILLCSGDYRDRNGCKSPRRPTLHGLQDEEARALTTVDELSLVGLSEDTDVSQVFDKNGQ